MRKLEIGYELDNVEIRKERIQIDLSYKIKIVHLTDFHLNGYSGKLATFIINFIDKEKPDLILLGGDFIDTKNGLNYLQIIFSHLGRNYNCIAIPGNHDLFFGVSKIKNIADRCGIIWCDKRQVIIIGKMRIAIDCINHTKVDEKSDLNILLLHEPLSHKVVGKRYNLILAGHLHGCQFVFWRQNEFLYPGAYIYKNNFLKKSLHKKSLYLISKGLGDTLPIRYNCSKDVIVINID